MLKKLGGLSRSALDRTRTLFAQAGLGQSSGGGAASTPAEPRIVPRSAHPLSRKHISQNALKVLRRLHEHDHAAYLVGGGVRDVLVGLTPKDFDVATDASPEEIRSLFRNSRIIGRRFRLVHVVFGRDVIEVATFRAAHSKGEGGEVGASGRIVRDNVFGSIEEDARRRDFSVNALYYNIADHSVVDYVGGLEDIEARVFHLIGDPVTRCEEDPVRILRAVRLAAKLRFEIHPDTLAAMAQTADGLSHVPPARLFEEVLKLFQGGYALRSFAGIVDHGLLHYLFPGLAERLDNGPPAEAAALRAMLDSALGNTDRRIEQDKPVTPAYLLAFMLWADVEARARQLMASGNSAADALQAAADEILAAQQQITSIPKRFSGPMREIWSLQPRLEMWRGKRALGLLEGRRFRAAYDFLCLRAERDSDLQPLAQWWTEIQEVDEEARENHSSRKPVIERFWGRVDGDGASASDPGEADAGKPDGRPRRRRRRRRNSQGRRRRPDSGNSGDSSRG